MLIGDEFNGTDRTRLREFITNVDSAYRLVNPMEHDLFYNFVLTKIKGEARSKLLVRRDITNWRKVKAALEEYYGESRTLDFYACQMFQAKQGKNESVTDWGSRVDKLVSAFREVALEDSTPEKMEGQVELISKLALASFIQGLADPNVRTMVRSRNAKSFGRAVQIAREEEIVMISKKEKERTPTYAGVAKGAGSPTHSRKPGNRPVKTIICYRCNKEGHMASQCKTRSTPYCQRCQKTGHLERDCRYRRTNKEKETHKKGSGIKTTRQDLRKCYACGRLGHISSECRDKTMLGRPKCYTCKKPGHTQGECWSNTDRFSSRSGKQYRSTRPKERINRSYEDTQRRCYNCGRRSHLIRECWFLEDPKPNRGSVN